MPAVPDNTLNFTYDDYGNRTKKQASNGILTYYINSGNTVLNEIGSTGTTTKSIVYGLSQIAEIDQNNQITYTHQDTLNSTVLSTDQSGTVLTKYQYDPFGQLIGQDGFTNTNYLYTNQEYDQESELYYYNARYYNPRLGRFISRDPYLGRDGDTISRNGYTYVKNNPLKYVDPSGEEEQGVYDKSAENQEPFLSTGDKALLGATGMYLVAGKWLSVGAKAIGGKLLGAVGFAYDIFRPEGYANANEAELLKQCGSECFSARPTNVGSVAGSLSNIIVNKEGDVVLYHGTSKGSAEKIIKNGFRSQKDLFTSAEYNTALRFGQDKMIENGATKGAILKISIPELLYRDLIKSGEAVTQFVEPFGEDMIETVILPSGVNKMNAVGSGVKYVIKKIF